MKYFGAYCCNICVKTYATSRSKRLQHTSENRWNSFNKRLQHESETLATYATCAISPDLLLQHQDEIITTYIWTFETLETYICNVGEGRPGQSVQVVRVGAGGDIGEGTGQGSAEWRDCPRASVWNIHAFQNSNGVNR
jgi:hypothetical protein